MHNGHITAGGEKFDSNAMTAAHRRLPMGTKLKVTNLANGKSVGVTVNSLEPQLMYDLAGEQFPESIQGGNCRGRTS